VFPAKKFDVSMRVSQLGFPEEECCTSSHDDDLAGKVGNVSVGFERLAAEKTKHLE
jgi:hypothetical protein